MPRGRTNCARSTTLLTGTPRSPSARATLWPSATGLLRRSACASSERCEAAASNKLSISRADPHAAQRTQGVVFATALVRELHEHPHSLPSEKQHVVEGALDQLRDPRFERARGARGGQLEALRRRSELPQMAREGIEIRGTKQ